MRRKLLILIALSVAPSLGAGIAMANGGLFAGPGPNITGNDTGGMFPYTPTVETTFPQIAATYCAHWGRYSHITSVHRKYGDYIAFVCIDKPWIIH